AKGRKTFAPAERRSNKDVADMLGRLGSDQQARLVNAMETIETLLGGDNGGEKERNVALREPKHGDFGWIVSAHGRLYAEEYDWADGFEGLVAQIVADFVNNYDAKRERCWIAEMDGENVGCVMVVKDSDEVARIRLLLVDPKGRGLGLGTKLVDECIAFARAAGYRKMTLWTHSVLTAARHTYEKAGFTLTSSEKKRSFGVDVVAEYWDMEL
ncbi:MAG: GNAT family N-acetyltransferase, partial [Pseudolabrys sp.]